MAGEELAKQRCIPCEGKSQRLSEGEAAALLAEVPGWAARGERLLQEFRFVDFAEAMRFVDRMAALAESEGHHPDFCVHWNRVSVTLWTHAVGGLSQNDFVLAAKIGLLVAAP
jgi:4a-hydroxytetrahydrobiopterin dehydratase